LKSILLFGAGKSATVLISYLLDQAEAENWKVIVADSNRHLIEEKTAGHPAAEPVEIDINNVALRQGLIKRSDLVISMMPPSLHILIAKDCLHFQKHLLTASYLDDEIRSLSAEAESRDIIFLCEMGLDPGIDHMSALMIINKLKAEGADINSFKSHCGGLVAPESDNNPWKYKISWNPRNVVLAGKAGALYREDGREISEPYETLFNNNRLVNSNEEEIGWLGYYPNRNSLPYIDLYKLEEAHTFIRTTLRYPQFLYGWKNVIDLKLTDEEKFYETDGKSLQAWFHEHMQKHGFGDWLNEKLTASFTQTKDLLDNLVKLMEAEDAIEEGGEPLPENLMLVDDKGELKDIELEDIKSKAAATMALQMHEANLMLKQLFFLGMDDDKTLVNLGICSAADVLQFALEKKLALEPGDKDMIVMLHEIGYRMNGNDHQLTSTLIVKGENSSHTAMAKTVGLPLGIAAKLILNGKIKSRGVRIPINEEIYLPVMKELEANGIHFTENIS